jgi:hypothetical protein
MLMESNLRYFSPRGTPGSIIDSPLQATGGYYEFAINHIDGAIIGLDLSNPRAGALEHWRRAPTDGELPALHYCADFYWQYWRNNPNVKNLRIYGAHSVVNDNTVRLVSRAFKNLGLTALKRWPGVSFEAGTDEFKALIGTYSTPAEALKTSWHIYCVCHLRSQKPRSAPGSCISC